MPWLILLCGIFFVSAFFSVFDRIFVHFEGQKANDAFVAAILGFQFFNQIAFAFEFDEKIEAGGLFLNGIGQLAQSPILFTNDLTAVSVITPRNLPTASCS